MTTPEITRNCKVINKGKWPWRLLCRVFGHSMLPVIPDAQVRYHNKCAVCGYELEEVED